METEEAHLAPNDGFEYTMPDAGDLAALRANLPQALDDFYMRLALEYHKNVNNNRYDTTPDPLEAQSKYHHHGQRLSQDLMSDVTVRSLQIETILQVLKWSGMTVREDLRELASHYVPVHPSNAVHIARANGKDEDEKMLAQVLVPKDKLLRLLYNVAKKNKHIIVILLAIDGLIENNVNNKYDFKRYLDRLRFDFDYNTKYASWWTRHDEDERFHVLAVRTMYNILLNKTDSNGQQYSADDYMKFVNINVRSVLNPESISQEETSNVYSDIAAMYVNTIGDSDRLQRLSKKFIQFKNL